MNKGQLVAFIHDCHTSVASMANPKAKRIEADSWMYLMLCEAERHDDLRDKVHEIARLTTCPMLPLMRAD